MTDSEIRTHALSDQRSWKEAYDRDGVVRIDGVYRQGELAEIERFFDNYISKPTGVLERSRGDYQVNQRGATLDQVDRRKSQVRALHPHRYHPDPVNRWLLHQNVAGILKSLLGRAPLAAQTMYYYKPPGSKGQGMHQDNIYLLTAPAVCIGVWTPIDDATEENGCLWLSPGSHREGVFCPGEDRSKPWHEYGDTHIVPFPRQHRPIAVPVKRGETLFFHGLLIHGSGPNRTKDTWRRTFIGHYCDEATETISKYYHPVLNMQGEVVSKIKVHSGGGPCGEDWQPVEH